MCQQSSVRKYVSGHFSSTKEIYSRDFLSICMFNESNQLLTGMSVVRTEFDISEYQIYKWTITLDRNIDR